MDDIGQGSFYLGEPMTVMEAIDVLSKMPPDSDLAVILGCGRKYVAADLDSGQIQIFHREKGTNLVVEGDAEGTEPVVGILW